jgi:phosphoglycolate phosphatase-like HAD superfamily hydrolase
VIKAVYFDGDQTLWDFEALMRRSLAATMAQLQALRPETAALDLDVESVVADREAVAQELRGAETNLERDSPGCVLADLEEAGSAGR